VLGAPGEVLVEHLAQRALRVDGARVDVDERRLAREAACSLGVPVLLADEVEHVGRVAGVEEGEVGREAQGERVLSHEPVADRVERAPEHAARSTARGGSRAIDHLACGPAGEGQQQDPLVRHTSLDETGGAGAQGRRLARPRSREYQQVPAIMVGGSPLLLVETGERASVGKRIQCEHVFAECRRSRARSSSRRPFACRQAAPNQVASASCNPASVPSPTQAT
jgi:hypothetical protein